MIPTGVIPLSQRCSHPPGPTSENTSTNQVTVYKLGSKYILWNTSDIAILRKEYGVIGVQIGCLPRQPLQNKFLAAPLLLSIPEVKYLRQKGVCNIREFQETTSRNCDQYREGLKADFVAQNIYLKQSIFSRAKEFTDNPAVTPAHLNLNTDIDLHQLPYHLVKLFESEEDPEYWSSVYSSVTNLELSDAEKFQCTVYTDLRARGYCVTPGTRFGGDFLVYPGDPSTYHAYYVVRVHGNTDVVNVPAMVAFGRVVSSVKKVAVLARVDMDNSSVSYTSFQWAGI